jgi:hypothetical protein
MRKLTVYLLLCIIWECFAAPMIEFEGKQMKDFGAFPANKTQTAVFIIKNAGDQELKIKKIHKTCGCSVTRLDKKTIFPGETAKLEADIRANSISGLFSKNIYVESNAENFRFLRLTLSGNSVPLIRIFPKKFIYMGTLTPGKSNTYSFKLSTSQADVKLELLPVQADFSVQADLKKSKEKEFLLTVVAKPAEFKKFLNCRIFVKISSPEGWEPVEIKLMGKTADNK